MDFAVNELQTLLKKATNVTIRAIPDTDESIIYSSDAKYISIGHTKLLEQANIEVNYDELLESGRVVKTVGNSLFIAGGLAFILNESSAHAKTNESSVIFL